jgi:hypothetical protein
MRFAPATTTALTIAALLSGCSEMTPPGKQLTAPEGHVSGSSPLLDQGIMTKLRTFSDGGCAVTEMDAAGKRHGVMIHRQNLPFAVPAVQHDPKTGNGNARIVQVTVDNPRGAPIGLTCLAPSTLNAQDLLASIRTSKSKVWSHIFKELPSDRVVPDSALNLPPTSEAVAFQSEMLVTDSVVALHAADARGASFNDGCYVLFGYFSHYDGETDTWEDIEVTILT